MNPEVTYYIVVSKWSGFIEFGYNKITFEAVPTGRWQITSTATIKDNLLLEMRYNETKRVLKIKPRKFWFAKTYYDEEKTEVVKWFHSDDVRYTISYPIQECNHE